MARSEVVALALDSARAAFDASTDFTVGLEEEFALLDATDLGLSSRFDELSDAASPDPVLSQSLAGELISSEVEIRSGRGEDLAAATAAQRDRRRRLFALAAERRIALGATATHPWSDYREQHIIDTEHYRRVEEGLKYVAWRNNTFSLHVHVGIRGADRAVLVCDRLRPVLPLLLAVSANSPFLDGRDTGLHSARTQIFTKSFPRCGVPDAFGSWDAYAAYIEFLARTRSIVEYTQVWWSVRPHFAFGTVEVRICDAQGTAVESEGLAALIVSCVAQAARDIDGSVPFVDPPGHTDRGERLAGRPSRTRRRADRSRARRAVPRFADRRAVAAVVCAGARGTGDRGRAARAQRRATAAADERCGRRPPPRSTQRASRRRETRMLQPLDVPRR